MVAEGTLNESRNILQNCMEQYYPYGSSCLSQEISTAATHYLRENEMGYMASTADTFMGFHQQTVTLRLPAKQNKLYILCHALAG
jgi:hypothetical protein